MALMAKFRPLTNEYKLTARTLRVVWDAMVDVVRGFADEGRIKFRRRKVGNEAFINAAVWYLADQPRDRQEAILRTYLPRLEAYLIGEDAANPPPPAVDPPIAFYQGDNPDEQAEAMRRKRKGG
jgi:hypothetical protein